MSMIVQIANYLPLVIQREDKDICVIAALSRSQNLPKDLTGIEAPLDNGHLLFRPCDPTIKQVLLTSDTGGESHYMLEDEDGHHYKGVHGEDIFKDRRLTQVLARSGSGIRSQADLMEIAHKAVIRHIKAFYPDAAIDISGKQIKVSGPTSLPQSSGLDTGIEATGPIAASPGFRPAGRRRRTQHVWI